MADDHRQTEPAQFWLQVGPRIIPLVRSKLLRPEDLPVPNPAGATVAQVAPNPQHPDVLGLKNLSPAPWKACTASGEQRTIAPQQTVRLSAGTEIDFGGVTGVITAQAPGAGSITETRVVQKEEMERLSRVLARAAHEGMVTQDQFDQLHRAFHGSDEYGYAWTFSLNTRQWKRADGTSWVSDTPPQELTMAATTFDHLMELRRQKTGGMTP